MVELPLASLRDRSDKEQLSSVPGEGGLFILRATETGQSLVVTRTTETSAWVTPQTTEAGWYLESLHSILKRLSRDNMHLGGIFCVISNQRYT